MKPTKKNFKKLIGRPVEVQWHDDIDADWCFYRVEIVRDDHVCMTGMADADNNPHDGTWVTAYFTELRGVWERT